MICSLSHKSGIDKNETSPILAIVSRVGEIFIYSSLRLEAILQQEVETIGVAGRVVGKATAPASQIFESGLHIGRNIPK